MHSIATLVLPAPVGAQMSMFSLEKSAASLTCGVTAAAVVSRVRGWDKGGQEGCDT